MRKSILSPPASPGSPDSFARPGEPPWLDLQEIARVELSSEEAQHPFEHALQGTQDGWRAAQPGPQVIRLHFDRPQMILQFREVQRERSQEFALFATSTGHPRKNLLRQQWTFSPGGSSIEVEDYQLDLPAVTALELEIDPGRHDKSAVASLQAIAIAG